MEEGAALGKERRGEREETLSSQRQLSVLLLLPRSELRDGQTDRSPRTQWTKERETVAGKSMIHILGRRKKGASIEGRKEGNGGKWRSGK